MTGSPAPRPCPLPAPRPHLFVARLWFEGNRFSRQPTDAAAFMRREDRRGPAALDGLAATATELAAVIDFARRNPAWQLTVSRCASAEPGGPIDQAWFDRFVADTLADLDAAGPSHIYLSLHGAAITTAGDMPELDWLRAIRQAAPTVPIAASFDLHGNVEPALVGLIDFGTAYRCHPHTDMRETAARALAQLTRRRPAGRHGPDQAGRRLGLVGVVASLGQLLPSFNMLTASGPMAELEALARQAERQPGIVDVSVFGGFPYADTPASDAAVMVWAEPAGRVESGDVESGRVESGDVESGDVGSSGTGSGDVESGTRAQALARTVAATLIAGMRERAPRFEPTLPDADAGLREAANRLASGPGLVAVTDPGDNPLSGGHGVSTTLLRYLLDEGRRLAPIATLAAGEIVFAAMTDATQVAAARQAGPGAELEIIAGRDAPAAFGGPLVLTARVIALTDGRFVNTGPMEQGRPVDCGPTALLDCAGIRLIVTSAVAPANDPAFFALHGIDLDRVRLLCVKAKNHFRAAFASRCIAIIDVDCPGPAAARLSLLPLRHWDGDGRRRAAGPMASHQR